MSEPSASSNHNEVEVMFYFAAIRLEALEHVSKATEQMLLATRGVHVGGGLAVYCSMAAQDLEPVVEPILSHERFQNFLYLGLEDGLDSMLEPSPTETVDYPTPWLRRRREGGRTWLSLCPL